LLEITARSVARMSNIIFIEWYLRIRQAQPCCRRAYPPLRRTW
jgi:hypothetical protein